MATPGYNTSGQNVSGQFGMPLYGVSGMPPFRGNYFWVDEANGSDGNTGGPQDPFATLTQALSKCTANNDDVIFVAGTIHLTATLTWSKSRTHLIGLAGPLLSGAALLTVTSVAATTGAISPLVNVTGSNCIFQNLAVISGINQAATQVCWAEAGGRNDYSGCTFNQVGAALAGAQAGNRALTVASVGCAFIGCVIGSDAIVRATGTNSNVEFLLGSGSTIFRGCTFPMWSSVAASSFVLAATTTCAGYVLFDDCQLINAINNAGGTALTQAFNVSATAGASFIVTPLSIVAGAVILNTGGTGTVYASSAVAAAGGNKVAQAT
jgi:hypothetical protein